MSELREVIIKVSVFLISDDVDGDAKKIASQIEHAIVYEDCIGDDIDIRHASAEVIERKTNV